MKALVRLAADPWALERNAEQPLKVPTVMARQKNALRVDVQHRMLYRLFAPFAAYLLGVRLILLRF